MEERAQMTQFIKKQLGILCDAEYHSDRLSSHYFTTSDWNENRLPIILKAVLGPC